MGQYADGAIGQHVVGLQPDDRMPHDWLRMVARVFASYRKKPLTESIVAYMDGLVLELESFTFPEANIRMTPGQSFIDDQFIGVIEDSYLKINTNYLQMDLIRRYWVVLHYEWINMSPPREPHLKLIYHNFDDDNDPDNSYNHEQMLILGYVTRVLDNLGNESIDITNEKRPWYQEMFSSMVGDTEVDPADGTEPKLPYLVAINEIGSENDGVQYNNSRLGTIDIGWAVDFHNELGNMVDYDARLHTLENSSYLYINGDKINTTTGLNTYYTISDIINDYYDQQMGSKACLGLINTGPTDDHRGATICADYDSNSSSWTNYNDIDNKTTNINDLTITSEEDLATLNGYPLLHRGNTFQSGQSLYFVGQYSDPPLTRIELQSDGTINRPPLMDGDLYYDLLNHSYMFYKNNTWIQMDDFVKKSGDNMSGELLLPLQNSSHPPSQNLTAITKGWLDDPNGGYVKRTGDSMTGDLILPGGSITHPKQAVASDSYASATQGGTVKMRLDLSNPSKPKLYMSNDGTNP